LIGSGDISVDEFVSFINNNVPHGTYGLKSIFRTIGKRKKILQIICLILFKIKTQVVMVLLKRMNLNKRKKIIKI